MTPAPAGVRRLRRGTSPSVVVLPPAGGDASTIGAIARHLPQDWSVVGLTPPGRPGVPGPAAPTFEALVEAYQAAAEPFLGPDAILVGHSLGGLAAFRLAQRLAEAGGPPRALVLSGVAPPADGPPQLGWADLDDDALIEEINRLGALPPALLDHPAFATHLAPGLVAGLRADTGLLDTCDIPRRPVDCPTLVFAASDDLLAPPDAVLRWSELANVVGCRVFPGPHMFFVAHAARVAAELVALAARLDDDRALLWRT